MVLLWASQRDAESPDVERGKSRAGHDRTPQDTAPSRRRRVAKARIRRVAAVEQLQSQAGFGRASYSLLITDDDQAFRESLGGIFETEGFHTFLASSGAEAIDIVRDQRIHLALLDQHMPRLTGLETLRILRQMNAVLPVILLTGDATEQLMREALSAQAFCVMSKPVSRSVVVYTVRRALGRYYDALRWELDPPPDPGLHPES